jgi:hypothetical protein
VKLMHNGWKDANLISSTYVVAAENARDDISLSVSLMNV